MSNAPEVRGLFLKALGRPVIVAPSSAEPTVTFDGPLTEVCPGSLKETELPVVVRAGEETFEVRATATGERAINGRIALVTGGAQGFGAEIARGLVDAGCFVYVADLNGEGAAAKAAELGGEGVAHPITVNVADEESVAAMAAEIERVTGGLDLVVSNAGIVRAGSVLEQDASAFRLSTDINYVAFFLVTKHLGQLLARQHSTAPEWLTDIIQINSKSGLVGSNKNAAYAGSKFGGIGLVQSFALEMVAHGVKVNAICPGNFYDGPLWSDPDRGLFLKALGRPVIVAPSSAEPTVTFDGPLTEVCPCSLKETELPVVVRAGEETFEVRATATGERAINGRIALVTGGAQGFGAEIARGLVDAGCFVYVADLNGEGAAAKAAELGGEGVAHPITVNVADEESVAAMASEIECVTGGLDLVVSNAGIVRAGSVLEQDAAAFRLSTDINYVAFFLVTKHLGQLLARQHSTAPEWLTDIIQINSKSGLVGSNKNAAYAGSKFGGIGLVQSFALEMVAHGVKVNAICPGNFYDGPLWSDPDRGLFVQYLNSGKVPGAKTVADVKEFYEAKVPMRRGAQGIDVLRAIFYIVEQEYETGQAVPVTGGQVMLS